MRYGTVYERPEVIRGYKYIRLKSGRLLTWWESFTLAERATSDLIRALSRCFKLVNDDPELRDYEYERLEYFLDEVERYLHHYRGEIEKARGIKTQEERIALLRNVKGRTPEEAEAFKHKADELERRLHERNT